LEEAPHAVVSHRDGEAAVVEGERYAALTTTMVSLTGDEATEEHLAYTATDEAGEEEADEDRHIPGHFTFAYTPQSTAAQEQKMLPWREKRRHRRHERPEAAPPTPRAQPST